MRWFNVCGIADALECNSGSNVSVDLGWYVRCDVDVLCGPNFGGDVQSKRSTDWISEWKEGPWVFFPTHLGPHTRSTTVVSHLCFEVLLES